MLVTIYSTTSSAYTRNLKDYLQTKGVGFTEKLIDQNDLAKKEMTTLTNGYLGVPFVFIQKDDKSIETVVGFDRSKIDHILGTK